MSATKLNWKRRVDEDVGDLYEAERTLEGIWTVILDTAIPPNFSVAFGPIPYRPVNRTTVAQFPTFLEADAYCAAENEKAVNLTALVQSLYERVALDWKKRCEKAEDERTTLEEEVVLLKSRLALEKTLRADESAARLSKESELQEKVSRLRERAIKAEAALRKVRLDVSVIDDEEDNEGE